MMSRVPFLLSLLVTTSLTISWTGIDAQDLASIGKDKPFSISGSVNANSIFYRAIGREGQRSPHSYFLTGNLNMALYGWSVPVSFSWSDQNVSYQQPFNQYGLSPTYKNVTVHLGYRSMTFSNYSMNGHLFYGVGLEAEIIPKLRVQAFSGRLQKAVIGDTAQAGSLQAYERRGWAMKLAFGDDKKFVNAIIFRAGDRVNSLPQSLDSAVVKPEENLVLSLEAGTNIGKRFTFKAEFASSALTLDKRNDAQQTHSLYDHFSSVFRTRASTFFYNACKLSGQYALDKVSIGMLYERIDPGYRTLGAYYFNNNLENISVTGSGTLLNNKLRISSQVGVQRNNLDNRELNTMRRLSGSLNANYSLSEHFVLGGSYSNFQTIVNFRSQFDYLNRLTPFENLDTLNYRQIAENISLNMNWLIDGGADKKHNINVNLALQQTADIQGGRVQPSGSKFYNLNSGYTLSLTQMKATASVGMNTNFTKTGAGDHLIFGPTASFRKSLLDKKLSASATATFIRTAGGATTNVMNNRAMINYVLKEQHCFELHVTHAHRESGLASDIDELTLQLGYSFNFSSR